MTGDDFRDVALRMFGDLKEKATRAGDVLAAADAGSAARGCVERELSLLRTVLATRPRIHVALQGDADGFLEEYSGDCRAAASDISRDLTLLNDALAELRSAARAAVNALEDWEGICAEALGI